MVLPAFPSGAPAVSLIVPPGPGPYTELATTRGWPLAVSAPGNPTSLLSSGDAVYMSAQSWERSVRADSGEGWPEGTADTVAVRIGLRLIGELPDDNPSAAAASEVQGQFSFAAWTVGQTLSNPTDQHHWSTSGGGVTGGWGSGPLDWEPVEMRYVASTGEYPSHVALLGAEGEEWVQEFADAGSPIPIADYAFVLSASPTWVQPSVSEFALWGIGAGGGMWTQAHRHVPGGNSGGWPLAHRNVRGFTGGWPQAHRHNGL